MREALARFCAAKKPLQVGGHQRIIHRRVMRREPMVAQVRREDMKFLREPRRDTKPVITGAEKPVQQNQRFTMAKLFKVKRHQPRQRSGFREKAAI